MVPPLVTQIDDGNARGGPGAQQRELTAIIFNERSGPGQVAEIINVKHAFVQFEVYELPDEQGRPAFLLIVDCETATAEQLLELVGSRLPDYIQARRFPPSRIESVRRTATKLA